MKAKRLTPIAVSSKETILVCDEEDEEQGKNDLSVIENAAAIRIQAAFRGHLVSLFDQVLNLFHHVSCIFLIIALLQNQINLQNGS